MRKFMPLLVLFALAGCELAHEPEIRTESSQLEQQGQWTATIGRVGSSSTITGGTLTIREFGSYSETEITIQGGANRAYQWRIFRGSCAATSSSDLGLHLASGSYPDLVANEAGVAIDALLLGGSLNSPQGTYSVRLRNDQSSSNWNGTSPIACGDLQRS